MNPTHKSLVYCTVFIQEHGDCEDFLPLYDGVPQIKQADVSSYVIPYNTEKFHSVTCFNNFDEYAENIQDRDLRIVSAIFLYQNKNGKVTQRVHQKILRQLAAPHASFSFDPNSFNDGQTAQKSLDEKIDQELFGLLQRKNKTVPKHTGNFIDYKV